MPPRFAYWTIILDGTPTSFRAREREELLPTFNQLKKKDPSALMKWFSGGTLWDSPEQASEKRRLEREQRFNQARSREERGRGEHPREGQSTDRRPHHSPPRDGRPSGPRPPNERPRDERQTDARPVGAPPFDHPGPPVPPASGDAVRKPRTLPRLKSSTSATGLPARPKGWRPGGEHRDPKDKYKLPPGEARKRWKRRNLGQPKAK